MPNDTHGVLWAAILGLLIGCASLAFHAAGIGTTNCLLFAAVFGCFGGAIWERPGPGLTTALIIFGTGYYLICGLN